MYKMLSLSVLFHGLPRHGTLELNNKAQNDSQLLLLVQLADAPCPRAPGAAMSHSYSSRLFVPTQVVIQSSVVCIEC